MLGIFEGVLELVRVDVQLNWSRGCKSLKQKVGTFDACSVFPGRSHKYDNVVAQEVQPDRISLPSTTAITACPCTFPVSRVKLRFLSRAVFYQSLDGHHPSPALT